MIVITKRTLNKLKQPCCYKIEIRYLLEAVPTEEIKSQLFLARGLQPKFFVCRRYHHLN